MADYDGHKHNAVDFPGLPDVLGGYLVAANNLADLVDPVAALTYLHSVVNLFGTPIDDANNAVLREKVYVPRVRTDASNASLTPDRRYGLWTCPSLATNATINAPLGGTAYDGQPLIIRIKDNGTPRTLTWNAIYVAQGTTLPPTTIASTWHYVFVRYAATPNEWHVEGVWPGTAGQPLDATLTALAALTTTAGKLIKATGVDTFSMIDVSSFIETLLDDANQAAAQGTLGVVPGTHVAPLSGGLIPTAYLPPLAINEVFPVASQAAMLALTAERGDVALRTDLDPDGWFVLTTNSPSTLADWVQITAVGAVSSVNGSTGAVSITLASLSGQPLDAELSAIAGLTSAADRLPYFTGSGTASLATFTAAARTVLDDATVAAMLDTLSGGSTHLSEIAAITGASNDDIMQRKAGAWKSRTLANVIADLVAAGIADLTTAQTMSAKRIPPRVTSTTTTLSLTPALANANANVVSALAGNMTINAPTGTPTEFEPLWLRIKDNGTSRTLTWNATYRTMTTALPTATTISKWLYVEMVRNATDSTWDVLRWFWQP